MSRLEQVIVSLVDMFEEYAGQDGDKKMNMDELKQLIAKEVENPKLKEKIHAADIKETMARLDKNRDGELNFREFSRAVVGLARGYYRVKTGKDGEED